MLDHARPCLAAGASMAVVAARVLSRPPARHAFVSTKAEVRHAQRRPSLGCFVGYLRKGSLARAGERSQSAGSCGRSIFADPPLRLGNPFRLLTAHRQWFLRSSAYLLLSASMLTATATANARAELSAAEAEKTEETAASSKAEPVGNYHIVRIAGDGRCLFRSVACGSQFRRGEGMPTSEQESDMADELRRKAVDEFRDRRKDVEWYIEGDFDTYMSRMSNPHTWGGEPELLMLSHVLKLPITVYIPSQDKVRTHVTPIAEYGQEYSDGKPPIKVLFDGVGHYNALLPNVISAL
eukprot:jgi/Chlat1/7059/Chrsp56S06675